ncbi:unnamed protein product [Ilex paraguariensis]|uniref:Uncharacterized protein n=1 Tax=Ilex paraguariensis TaxID=185542 RepID=A0ABC8RZF3_9AQUA
MTSQAPKSSKPSKPPNQSSNTTPQPSRPSSSLTSHLAMVELKQRILTSLSKLSDRDTHQIAIEDLEKIIQTLSNDGVSMLLNCLCDATNDPKPIVKKESLRLLTVLCATHTDSTTTHWTKVIAHIVKRLKDSDSGVRDACRDSIGALSSQYLKGEGDNVGLGYVVSLFVKPLFEAMNENSKNVQGGAAMCMAKMVECASDPPISSFQKLCPRICKYLNNPNFLAKAALFAVVASLSQVGAIAPQSLEPLLQSTHDSDWATRKAAADALSTLALHSSNFTTEGVASTLAVLEACRFDKIKPARDSMAEALQLWKKIAGKEDGAADNQKTSSHDVENSETADLSEKDLPNPSGRRTETLAKDSSGGPSPDNSVSKIKPARDSMAEALQLWKKIAGKEDGAADNQKTSSHVSDVENSETADLSEKDLPNPSGRRTETLAKDSSGGPSPDNSVSKVKSTSILDKAVGILKKKAPALTDKELNPEFFHNLETRGSDDLPVEVVVPRRCLNTSETHNEEESEPNGSNSGGRLKGHCQPDDGSVLFKYRNIDRGTAGTFSRQRDIADRSDLNQRESSSTRVGFSKTDGQSEGFTNNRGNWLAIQRQLLQLERQQAHLMNMLQDFMGGSHDSMIKPARDSMAEALQLWKKIAGKEDGAADNQKTSSHVSDVENSETADLSEKDLPNPSGRRTETLAKDSSGGPSPDNSVSKVKSTSILDKAVGILKKKAPALTDKELNPEFFHNLETRGSDDLPVEVVVPRRCLNTSETHNEEESEPNGSNSGGRLKGHCQPDDGSVLFKYRNIDRGTAGTFSRQRDIADRSDLNQRESSSTRVGFSKTDGQSEGFTNNRGNWLAIQRQLLQLERQQAHLMNMLQDFMGGSHDSMVTLESRVRGLERVVEDMARDLSISAGRRGGNFMVGFEGSSNRHLSKYNGFSDYSSAKIKPARDSMAEALQLWKKIAGKEDGAADNQKTSSHVSDVENSETADLSEKDLPNPSGRRTETLAKDSSGGPSPDNSVSKVKSTSILDKAVGILKKKAPALTDKELNPEFFHNLETRGSDDLPVEVVVPRRCLNTSETHNEEESEPNGSNSGGRLKGHCQPDDGSVLFKYRNIDRGTAGTFSRQRDIADRSDLNQRESSSTRVGFSKTDGQSEGFTNNRGNWLAIQRQLLQLERQQAHLMNMLQDFMGGSHDSMVTLESRVRGLERVVEDMARDLSISAGRRGGNFMVGFEGSSNRHLSKYNGFSDYSSAKVGRGGDGRVPFGERFSSSGGIASGMRGRGPPWRSDASEGWGFHSYGKSGQMGSRRAPGGGSIDVRSPKSENENDQVGSRRAWDKGAGPVRYGEGPSARSVWQASKDEATLEAIRVAGEDNGTARTARAGIPELTAEALGDDNIVQERDPVWTSWSNAMDAFHVGDMDSAFAEVLSTGDDNLLVKLMDRSGPVIDQLSSEVASEILHAVAEFLMEQNLSDICLSWIQQDSAVSTVLAAINNKQGHMS